MCVLHYTYSCSNINNYSLFLFRSGLMRKEHPGVALSVKTHQAIRSVLNHSRDTIKQLLGGGVLDECDAEKLLLVRGL